MEHRHTTYGYLVVDDSLAPGAEPTSGPQHPAHGPHNNVNVRILTVSAMSITLKIYGDAKVISKAEPARTNGPEGVGLVNEEPVLEALLDSYQVPQGRNLPRLGVQALHHNKPPGQNSPFLKKACYCLMESTQFALACRQHRSLPGPAPGRPCRCAGSGTGDFGRFASLSE